MKGFTDIQRWGDTQRIKVKKEFSGEYLYTHNNITYTISKDDNQWNVTDEYGDWVGGDDTKKGAIISLQHHLKI